MKPFKCANIDVMIVDGSLRLNFVLRWWRKKAPSLTENLSIIKTCV